MNTIRVTHTHGLIAAALTPFDNEGNLALERVPNLRDFLHARAVAGVFVGGSTGEWPSLTTQERLALAEAWLVDRKTPMKVFVHVGHTALHEARKLAQQAEELGADAIATVAPLMFRPSTAKGLAEYCQQIASAAPHTPFYFYHFPALTGMGITGMKILRELVALVPSFCGLKYTHETLADYADCTRYSDGRYDVLYGRDEMLVASLSMGAKAAIGSTYNYASPISARIMEAFAAGKQEEARQWQMHANRVLAIADTHGGGKSIMRALGCDCGPYRLPIVSAEEAAIESLRNELKKEGLWEMLQTDSTVVQSVL